MDGGGSQWMEVFGIKWDRTFGSMEVVMQDLIDEAEA